MKKITSNLNPGRDPALTRKRGLHRHPGSLVIGLLGIAFAAYVFGYLPQADAAYSRLLAVLNGQRDHALSIYQNALPVSIGLAVLLVAWFLVKKLRAGAGKLAIRRLTAGRPAVTEPAFAELAARHGVHDTKVAHHVYHALLGSYGGHMRLSLDDELRRHLGWTQRHLQNVIANLPRHCDRRKNIKGDPAAVRTVLDLLLYVESCPLQSVKFRLSEPARRHISNAAIPVAAAAAHESGSIHIKPRRV